MGKSTVSVTTPDMSVTFGPLSCKNPVWVAAGTFLYGREYSQSFPLSKLGAVCTKGTSLVPWQGNWGVRTAETPAGMLNTIGLHNPGIEHYIEYEAPWLREQGTIAIVNIVGKTVEEYAAVAARVGPKDADAIEINVSCPNVKEGGVAFGTDPHMLASVVTAVRKATKLPIITKLSPNVTDIKEMARAAEAAGSDGLSVANCLTAMAIDIWQDRPVLGTVTGGLSGPAVRPVILRMVWEVVGAVKIPVAAVGGASRWEDVVEFLMAGARAVQVGSALFRNPRAAAEMVEGVQKFLKQREFRSCEELIGRARPEFVGR